jgi:recombination protein RecR
MGEQKPETIDSAKPAKKKVERRIAPEDLLSRPSVYPKPVDNLIDELAKLPGIGRRSAERLAFHILKSESPKALALAQAIQDVKQAVRNCAVCSNLSDGDLCKICADPQRDRTTVLVVEQPKDLIALEQTASYRGVYHVLLGRISPLDGIGPEDLTIADLLGRVSGSSGQRSGQALGQAPVREVILGLNPNIEGDGTALYLAEELQARNVRVTRLARGLPSGSQLEYANKAVLMDAILGRRNVD